MKGCLKCTSSEYVESVREEIAISCGMDEIEKVVNRLYGLA